ncbi:carbonic anhydrase family protein [Orbaceae bacterium ESL0727]|nr:carbonic anhydrase family protein [Orbaceae bacterium ESL0727]
MKRSLIASLFMVMPILMQTAPAQAHWGYEGKEGPANWGELSADFAACHTGKYQSPINITHALDISLPPLTFTYNVTHESIVNNGHTIQVTAKDEDVFSLDDETFQLVQYHFHAPSENQIDGKSYPLEAHFVHATKDGALAVVAVMFDLGEENRALTTIIDTMPNQQNKDVEFKKHVDVAALYPADKTYYRYSGSLTTPPCTEGVRWLVMKNPITLSAEQLKKFQAALKHANNRPVQPLNGRVIVD